MSESGSATLSSVTDNLDGTYTATMTNTMDESVTVTAAFGGSNVTDTATVSFGVSISINNIAGDDNINSSEDDTALTVSGSTGGVQDGGTVTVVLNNITYETLVSSNSWSFDIPVVDLQALLSSFNGNSVTSNSPDITTTITLFYEGTPSDNLAGMIDGIKSTNGTMNYQVHPTNADGETITFNLGRIYTGGSFIFYNRVAGCCSSRIQNSTLIFKLNGAPVQTSTISSDASTITMSAPNSSYDEVLLTFSGDLQNFREIEIVPDAYILSANVSDFDGNSASSTRNVTHNLSP
jgi:hypothetical protein